MGVATRQRMDSVPMEVVYAPWLVSAMEQLGIENY